MNDNRFEAHDLRFLVEMAAEMAAKIDTSIPEGAKFEDAFRRLMDAADAYFALFRRA